MITTSRLALMLINAAFGGFALAWALDNLINGKPAKVAASLAVLNFGAVAVALI